ncbi:MAG TPA: hypothetical protein VFM69_07760 [Pricia sp.]|nr:hypothetical protein [Pricia sp.]
MRNKLFFYALAVLLVYSCSKDDQPVDDPRDAILGKWQLTHLGNGIDAPPYEGDPGYQEYLPDSVMRIHNDGEDGFIYQKYWFNDSLLLQSATYVDAIDKDTIVYIERYKYEFLGRNRLKLDWQVNAIFTTSIYKRIK